LSLLVGVAGLEPAAR